MTAPYELRYLPVAEEDLLGILVFYVLIRRTVQVRRVIHGARRYDFLLPDR